MVLGIVLFLAWTALEIVVIAASIAWGFENGQWKNIEEPKYRMLLDLEPQPWPGREQHTPEQEQHTPDVKQGNQAANGGEVWP